VSEVQIKELEPVTVMCLPFTGAYDQTRGKLELVMSWLLRVGHPYSAAPFALYYDDPAKVPAEELRAEVCLPIEEDCEGEDEIVRKDLPAVTVAFAVHTGPNAGVSQVYEQIFQWIGENGYSYVEGEPTREVFLTMYGQVEDPAEFVTEVQVPVQKA